MLDEMMLKKQNKSDRLLVLLFLYNKNMNMNRPKTDNDVAVYGITFRASAGLVPVPFIAQQFPIPNYKNERY